MVSSCPLRGPKERASLGLLTAALLLSLSACEPPQRAGEAKGEAQVQAAQATDSTPPTAPTEVRKATIPADGWNDAIAWRGFEEGLAEAQSTGRPLMMVVHTSWCSKCRALKGEFNANPTIEELSRDFIMVHVDQDLVPQATLYAPDGTYIPRVMFLDADGKLDRELANPQRSGRFRYFYTPQEDLVGTMREALDRHGKKT